MEFLTTPTQISHIGYPLMFFYLIAITGLFLVIFRPYWAFLFSLFCLAGRNYHAAVFTRTPFAGPYLNLNDLLLWIALFAMLSETLKYKRKIWMPKILFAIFALVIIGDIQSIFKYGFIKEVLRRVWSTAIFPILFLVGVNMVRDEKRARHFYWTLFFGALVSALQHFIYIKSVTPFEISSGSMQIRTISYIFSGGLYLLLGAVFTKPDKNIKGIKLVGYYTALSLIGLSYILSLTRGIYITLIFVLITLPLIIRKKIKIPKIALNTGLIIVVFILIIPIFFPKVDLLNILTERFQSFIYKETFKGAYKTRWLGATTELNLWLNNSTLILGVGSYSPPKLSRSPLYEVYEIGATGHVALTTYLAHFGILGLLIYGILLPITTIKSARDIFFNYNIEYGNKIALIAISLALSDLIGLFWSNHYIAPISHIPALIYGAIWGISKENSINKKRIFRNQKVLYTSSDT